MIPLEMADKNEIGNKVEYTNPGKTRMFCQWLVGIIDDNSIMLKLEILGYSNTATTMMEVSKRCLEIWHRLVHVTVGNLELRKSSYSLMAWKLKEGKEVKCDIGDEPGYIRLKSEKYKGIQVEITRNEAW